MGSLRKGVNMNPNVIIKVGLSALMVLSIASAQTQRWVYRYDGPGNSTDVAYSIVYGSDGNIYIAGGSDSSTIDFTVISLDTSGSQRWLYRYDGPANNEDEARSIVYGSDGNLYAAGYSCSTNAYYDFTVISLDTSGSQRWLYRYNGPSDSTDIANAIVYGSDGNLYIAGYSCSTNTSRDFTVISVDTGGNQRWVYRYNGTANDEDVAYSIVYGGDGNIYAAGRTRDTTGVQDFAVISLDTAGNQRWIYKYNGPGNSYDCAFSITYGGGNIYVAGYSQGINTGDDFTVISLDTAGNQRWVFRGNGPANGHDDAYSIVYGGDGNIYAAGRSCSTSTTDHDFTVISLTSDSGNLRWGYRYDRDEEGNGSDTACAIIYGSDGNVYAVGRSESTGVQYDFTVVALDTAGNQLGIYLYNGPGNGNDAAHSIVYGGDGNLYTAGVSDSASYDFIVISLGTGQGQAPSIEEPYLPHRDFIFTANTLHKRILNFSLTLPSPMEVSISLYDISGRLIDTWFISAPKGISFYKRALNLSAGVYFLRAESLNKAITRKIVIVE